ncbi:thiol-disulfide isomerase/thioredoxin [Pedobacter sp. UYP30]|uniref:TlpA disulfide reductase family protein n=1 Tax=Pedobacter sp. UYP30 TaxID=1756400 RepID=UPI0033924CB7
MKNKWIALMALILMGFGANAQVKLIKLSSLENRLKAGGDTTFVINFWASWCKPCVKELPAFEQLKSATSSKKVKVLLVSTDLKSKVESSVKQFVKIHNLTGEIYVLDETPGSFAQKIDANWSGALPATLIVNTKKGRRDFQNKPFTYEELLTATK